MICSKVTLHVKFLDQGSTLEDYIIVLKLHNIGYTNGQYFIQTIDENIIHRHGGNSVLPQEKLRKN